MKICVEYPYSTLFTGANVYTDKDNRRRVYLYGKDTKMTTSYARYLMSVKLGRFLDKNEVVDHIDNDRTNDVIENLQILTEKDNIDKYLTTIEHHVHGTNSMYRSGCRCALCKQYKSDYMKSYYTGHPEKKEQRNARRRKI